MEIDLNHINLTPGNVALLGFNIEEPLIILFNGKETKFLNLDDEIIQIDFKKAWNSGMLEF
jgi:hypothetical protein